MRCQVKGNAQGLKGAKRKDFIPKGSLSEALIDNRRIEQMGNDLRNMIRAEGLSASDSIAATVCLSQDFPRINPEIISARPSISRFSSMSDPINLAVCATFSTQL